MGLRKKTTPVNGKPKPFGFDSDADFIPFDLSEDENESKEITDAEVASQAAIDRVQSDIVFLDDAVTGSEEKSELANGDGRKRKRDDEDEEGPPSRRLRTSFTPNPWQKDRNDYTFSKEVSRMYILP